MKRITQIAQTLKKTGEFLYQLEKRSNLNIFMVARKDDKQAYKIAKKIILEHSKILDQPLFYTDESTFQILSKEIESLRTYEIEDEKKIDLAITVGGDGTFLFAANKFYNRPVPPLISVQKGSLGFLCEYPVNQFYENLNNIFKKITLNSPIECLRSMRLMGNLVTQENQPIKNFHALNEISINRAGNTSAIKLNIYVDDIFLTSFSGDGLLISTPTGSSAYAASAGGPLIQNDVDSIAIIPICPFSLSFRPIIFPATCRITIQATKTHNQQHFLIQCDSQMNQLISDKNWTLTIEQSPFELIKVRDHLDRNQTNMNDWITRIRNNMNWNKYIQKEKFKDDEKL